MLTLSVLSGLLSLGTGIWQAFKSNDLAKEQRPEYKAPIEADQALNVAKQQAYGSMPGEEQARQRIEQQSATAMSRATNVADSGSDVLGFAAGINKSSNDANRQVDAREEQYRSNAIRNLQGALGVRAGYTDQEFKINQMDPYASKELAGSVMKEGAIQNIAGGVNSSISNYMSYKMNQDWMDRAYGKQPGDKTTSTNDFMGDYFSNRSMGGYYPGKKGFDPGIASYNFGSDYKFPTF
jgi:hypothetical protein